MSKTPFKMKSPLKESPPGMEHVVKSLKGKVDNPYAVAWSMYKKKKK